MLTAKYLRDIKHSEIYHGEKIIWKVFHKLSTKETQTVVRKDIRAAETLLFKESKQRHNSTWNKRKSKNHLVIRITAVDQMGQEKYNSFFSTASQ